MTNSLSIFLAPVSAVRLSYKSGTGFVWHGRPTRFSNAPFPQYDTRTRNRRQKNGVDLWRRFLKRTCVIDITIPKRPVSEFQYRPVGCILATNIMN